MAIPIKRDQWVTARIKVTKAGKILAKVPPSAIKNPQRVRNVAEGFMDANGVFHPIRKSWDYERKRAGEKAEKRTAWQTKSTERKPAKKRAKKAVAKRKPAKKTATKKRR